MGALALALSQVAAAQQKDIGWYVGGAIGQSKANDWCSDEGLPPGGAITSCSDTDTAWKILGGYQFHRNFAVEAQYQELGKVKGTANVAPFGNVDVSADNTQFAVSILGILPVGDFQLFGKLGYESISQSASANAAGITLTNSGSDSGALYGLGAKYAIGQNLRLRAEWEHGDTLNIDVMSVGAEWRF